MAIQRWSPWRDIMRMQEELNRAFETFFRPITIPEMTWIPDVDVYEKDDKIYVRMDLPEVKAEDVDVSIIDNTLRVKGERKHLEEIKEENYYRMERRFGSFERMIDLPVPVKAEEVQATYKDGVLEISMPKAEVKKAVEIKVKAA